MPSWKAHNKWAKRMGLDESVPNEVNKQIDFPDDAEYDEGRKRINTMVSQGYRVWQRYGEDVLKAYVLYLLLDEIYEVLRREITRRRRDIGIDLAIDYARIKVTGLLGKSYAYREVGFGEICDDIFAFILDNGAEIYYDFIIS